MGTLSFNEYKNINKNNRHKHVYCMSCSIKCFNIKYFFDQISIYLTIHVEAFRFIIKNFLFPNARWKNLYIYFFH
jgi:hypothetical protein